MNGANGTQDIVLNTLRRSGVKCTVVMSNGFMMKDVTVVAFDTFSILCDFDSKKYLIYKSSIASISFAKDTPVEVNPQA